MMTISGKKVDLAETLTSQSERQTPASSACSLAGAVNLNFVFETGSGARNGGHNVRSQAAKHGWLSRKPKNDGQSTSRGTKRRKLQHQAAEPVSFTPQQQTRRSDSAVGSVSKDQLPLTRTDSGASFQSCHLKDTTALVWSPQKANVSYLPSPTPTPPPRKLTPAASDYDTGGSCLREPSRPSRQSTRSPFLEIVMNEDCPRLNEIAHEGNPFCQFPVDWCPLYGLMIERYRAITAAQVMEINTDDAFKKAVCELPLQLCISEAEPALLFGIMGTTAAMLEKAGAALEVTQQFFQRETVRLLNTALDDPKRVFRSSVIQSVALIALHESTRGAPGNMARVYSTALRTMINARGGLEMIYHTDSHGPMFVRFLVWLDKVIADQSGAQRTFPNWDDSIERATTWDGMWERMRRRLPQGEKQSAA